MLRSRHGASSCLVSEFFSSGNGMRYTKVRILPHVPCFSAAV
ncbi:hypothetical protein [Anaplasma phagocytophilum]|nr:hypothetical protein [Anaplasma phagocytophilum]